MERRIGSGRLISDISNRDFRSSSGVDNEVDRGMDRLHSNVNETGDDNNDLSFRDNRGGIGGIGDRRLFDQHPRDKYDKDSISSSNRIMNMRRYSNTHNVMDSYNDAKYNLLSSSATLLRSSQSTGYGDNMFIQQRTMTFKRNQRTSDRSKDKLMKSRDMDKEEPEWFSGGPLSQHDTIELRGFDESDEKDDVPSGDENRSTKSEILDEKKITKMPEKTMLFDKKADNDSHAFSKSSKIITETVNTKNTQNAQSMELKKNESEDLKLDNERQDDDKNKWKMTDNKNAIDKIQEITANNKNCLDYTDIEFLQDDQSDSNLIIVGGDANNENKKENDFIGKKQYPNTTVGNNVMECDGNKSPTTQSMREPNVVNDILNFLDMDTLEYPLIVSIIIKIQLYIDICNKYAFEDNKNVI